MNTNVADSSSSSESSSYSSDLSVFEDEFEGEMPENTIDSFADIHPWRFEPPGRSSEPQESEENMRDVEPSHRRRDLDSEEW